MQANVYYLDPPEEKFESWSEERPAAYLKAKHHFEYDNPALLNFTKIATVEVANDNPEEIWMYFQNDAHWLTDNNKTVTITKLLKKTKRRSMDVGDLIVWENNVVVAVDSVGFKEVSFNPEDDPEYIGVPKGLEKFQS